MNAFWTVTYVTVGSRDPQQVTSLVTKMLRSRSVLGFGEKDGWLIETYILAARINQSFRIFDQNRLQYVCYDPSNSTDNMLFVLSGILTTKLLKTVIISWWLMNLSDLIYTQWIIELSMFFFTVASLKLRYTHFQFFFLE